MHKFLCLLWSFKFRNLMKMNVRQSHSLYELRIVRMRMTLEDWLKSRNYQTGKQMKSFQFHRILNMSYSRAQKSNEQWSKRKIHSQSHETIYLVLNWLINVDLCYFKCYNLFLCRIVADVENYHLFILNYVFCSTIKFLIFPYLSSF